MKSNELEGKVGSVERSRRRWGEEGGSVKGLVLDSGGTKQGVWRRSAATLEEFGRGPVNWYLNLTEKLLFGGGFLGFCQI